MTQYVHNDNAWDVVFPTLEPPVTIAADSDGELPDTAPAHKRDEESGELVEVDAPLALPVGVRAIKAPAKPAPAAPAAPETPAAPPAAPATA